MSNIVLIPTHRRADFLAVTLEHIKNANGSEKNCYVFLIDRGYSPEILNVVNAFDLPKEIRFTPHHRYQGNSYNVLEGYKFAADAVGRCESKLVYLIEEDIWVSKDFFDFHERVQSQFNPFCVSAVHCQNDSNQYPMEPASVYYHHTFQSLGISWKPDKLRLITKHARPEYYRNMKGYIRALAPNSQYGMCWTEQDGLINRLVELNEVKCLYPYVPRAYHAGFFGYNRRGVSLEGSLEDRIAKLKTMTKEEMNDHASVFKDINPIDLSQDNKITEYILK